MSPAIFNLGVVLVRFNRLDEAIACFQNALKIEPDNWIAQEYLASVLAIKPKCTENAVFSRPPACAFATGA
jgi:tetratricopeptide (TPR) repeat protein